MSTFSKRLLAGAVATALLAPMSAMATNGMNLEGYGPIALGMGGASYAYNNGTAGLMNNPATLGFIANGTSRFDIALGALNPTVKTTMAGTTTTSSAKSFYMPAIGWIKNNGKYTYGVGVFAQGGMGTDYSANSPMAMGSGKEVMSQVGVGRIMAPLVVNVNNKLKIGGSIDFVWAEMDLRMAVPTSQLGSMVTGASAAWNTALGNLTTAGATWGRFDFADKSDYSGAAKGTGFAAKIGVTYEVNSQLTIGATYHSKTNLSDLKAHGATLSAGTPGTTMGTFVGDISVKNFQWPATYGVGLAYTPNKSWMIAADYKHIGWKAVMQSFQMTFNSPGMGDLSVAMPQNWKDQNVFELGAAYRATDKTTIRFGANFANNPIPDTYMNYLFPATVENAYTGGVGYAIDHQSGVNFALSYVPKVSVATTQYTTSHSQINWQLMYSRSF